MSSFEVLRGGSTRTGEGESVRGLGDGFAAFRCWVDWSCVPWFRSCTVSDCHGLVFAAIVSYNVSQRNCGHDRTGSVYIASAVEECLQL